MIAETTASLGARSWLRHLSLASLAITLAGCSGAKLPDCVLGKHPPPPADKPAAASLEVAIDGSGSMLGLTGSPAASAAWKAVLNSVGTAAASTGVPIKAYRSGSGRIQPISSVNEATAPCFFSGCGSYGAVSSTLDSLWSNPPQAGAGKPVAFRVAISDLEVDSPDISRIVGAIKPHVDKGAVVAILAIRLPFEGDVYNSQGEVIASGKSKRPVYMLTTGPRSQLHTFLDDVRQKAALGGIPTDSIQITYLDDQVTLPTLTANDVQGVPPPAITVGLPVQLGAATYQSTTSSGYQFVRLTNNAQGVRLGNRTGLFSSTDGQPDYGLVNLEPIGVPGGSPVLGSGIRVKGMRIDGQDLVLQLGIKAGSPAAAIRAAVPRGQLPADWWITWNRSSSTSATSKEQTDGLLLLLISLGKLMVTPGSSPAAAFCLTFSH